MPIPISPAATATARFGSKADDIDPKKEACRHVPGDPFKSFLSKAEKRKCIKCGKVLTKGKDY